MRILGIAVLITLAVGLLDADGWPGFVIGAVLALALWVMLLAGSYAGPDRGVVDARVYASAAVVGVVLGYVVQLIGGNGSFWAVGFIVAGALAPTTAKAVHDR